MSSISDSLNQLMSLEGAIGAALVDYKSGMTLGTIGGDERLDLDIAGAGNTDVVRSKMKVMDHLGLDDRIEDILITLGTQYHLIRFLHGTDLFLYFALDRDHSNLGMARHRLTTVENLLEV